MGGTTYMVAAGLSFLLLPLGFFKPKTIFGMTFGAASATVAS